MNFNNSLVLCGILIFGLLECIQCQNPDHQSSQCFIACVNTFHDNIQESLPEYESIDKLHGIELRKFLREADDEELQQFCSSIYEPFLICMTKCPKTLGRDWGIWDYRALSHICMDHLEEFKHGMQCLHSASDDADQECPNQLQNHQSWFQHVEDHLDNRLNEDRAGENIRNLLDGFCPSITNLMDCERPILENHCTKDITKLEVDLIYMFLGTVQSRLYAAKLMKYYPESCKTIYDQHFFGAPKIFNFPESNEDVTQRELSSSQCFTECVSEFHVRTETNAKKFHQIDELHGLNLRQFVRNSDANELENYCKKVYLPFLICTIQCPKSLGRDWGIWDYRSLTLICIDHLEDFKSSLPCLRQLEDDNNIAVCRDKRADHANRLNDIENELKNPTETEIENKLFFFCRSLEILLTCEHPIESKRCGLHITLMEQDFHYAFLGQIQSRLHASQLDHSFPENCQKMYQDFITPPVIRPGVVSTGRKSSSECVIDCAIMYQNFTHTKFTKYERFYFADKKHGIELRRFFRHSYSEELRGYCNEVFIPFMTCLTSCPKSVGRDITMYDYIQLSHVCIDHLDEFADNIVCLKSMEDPDICKNESKKHHDLFKDLQVLVDDKLYEANSGQRLEAVLGDYCSKLDELIACERPVITQKCPEKVTDLEHNILIMYLATVKGRMVNAHLHHHYPINCTLLDHRLALHSGTSSSVNLLFCIIITFGNIFALMFV